jgi:ribosomal protein S18 acetylase RimI-like enzyme
MADFEIITLPTEDWQRYREIRLESLRTEPRAFGSTYAETLQRSPEYFQGRLADATRGETSWLLFAQAGDRLVGIIGAFLDKDTYKADVISVYVSPDWRKHGVGRALMAAILDTLSRVPTIQVAALTVNAKQSAALALYQSFGFKITEQIESLMGDGNTYLEYLMEKALI